MDKYQCDIFAVICLSGYGCGEGMGIWWYRVAVSCRQTQRGPMDEYRCDIFAVICLSGYGCGEGMGIRWYRVVVS